MRRAALSLSVGVLVGALTATGTAAHGADALGQGLKANLDLPVGVSGVRGDEEAEAPEVLFFFGQVYEASAVVFALDESSSMGEQGRFDLQRREVTRAVNSLSGDAEYSVLYYNRDVVSFRDSPVEASANNKAAGIAFVGSRAPDGLTCIGKGVVKALEIAAKAKNPHKAVIVTSDGGLYCETGRFATSTAAEMQKVLQETLAANPDRKIAVHAVYVGPRANTRSIQFMQTLARAHGGTFRAVSR